LACTWRRPSRTRRDYRFCNPAAPGEGCSSAWRALAFETGGSPMFGVKARRAVIALILALAAASVLPVTASASDPTIKTGAFADGATWLIEVPTPWNGTLLLY